MLSLNLINQSFNKEGESFYLDNLQKLFDFFSKLNEWKNLKGTMNLILIDDSEIKKLNKEYRDKDTPTDVLSFPYLSGEEIIKNQDHELVIGEVFISKTRAREDAKEFGISLDEELNKLFVHGLLHILGYDHIEEEDFLEMKKMEDYILGAFQEEKSSE